MYPDTVGLKIIPTVSNIIKSINFLVSHPDKMENMSTLSREFAITSFSDKNAQVITKSYQL
jgi:hypothetical protein